MTPVHDEAARRFAVAQPEGQAVLDYEMDDRRIVFTHTYVPPTLRGRGLAEAMVRHALVWAAGTGKRVEATCSYVSRFL